MIKMLASQNSRSSLTIRCVCNGTLVGTGLALGVLENMPAKLPLLKELDCKLCFFR